MLSRRSNFDQMLEWCCRLFGAGIDVMFAAENSNSDGDEHSLESLHGKLEAALQASIGADGGVAWVEDGDAESEPTAMAAIALGDERCSDWLLANRGEDGLFILRAGPVENISVAPLAAIALPEGPEREVILDFIGNIRSEVVKGKGEAPLAWGWTKGTYSWVEPTSRVLLALRLLRPEATGEIDEAVAMLAERETTEGGWNYGNASALGTDLRPYAQTTAIATLALQGLGELAERGVASLMKLARQEMGSRQLRRRSAH